MSSRITRLVFGIPLPKADQLGDACVADAPVSPASETSLFPQLGYRFLSDEKLVEHLQLGNADALTYLFERHSSHLFGIARRILRNDAEAEDVVQRIFFDVFRSIQQFNPEKGDFRTWLLMFAYHRTFNRRRHLTAIGFFATDALDDIFPELIRGAGQSACYSPVEAGVLIDQVLSSLQPRQRRTIELVYYEGLTAEEVSARTGETVRVVRHNLYRGLEKLRKVLFKSNSVNAPRSKGDQR